MLNKRLTVLVTLVLIAALFRLLPHPPNFQPVAAMALFAGARLRDNRLALLVPLLAMLASDALIGFHDQMLLVYGCMALTVGIGTWLRDRPGVLPVGAAALGSSALFFAVTNFGVWAASGMYPLTPGGLVACYVAGIPFFHNTLAGTAVFTVALFGGWAALERWRPALRAPASASA